MALPQHAERWIDVGGIRTRYFDQGEGEPVILMHGGTIGDESGACSADVWEFNFTALAEAGYRAIAVDKLGQGYTDNPTRTEDWSLRGQVAHMAAFASALQCGPIHAVGHSRGGYLACRLTLDHPDLVTSCMIIDSNTCAPGIGRNDIVMAGNPHPPGSREASFWAFKVNSFGDAHITDTWLDAVDAIVGLDKSKIAARRMKREGLGETVFLPSLRRDRDAMFIHLEHEAILRPTMVLWGYNDPTATLQQCYDLHELLAKHQTRTQLHLLNHAGHFSYREKPAEFNRVLVEFLKGVAHGC